MLSLKYGKLSEITKKPNIHIPKKNKKILKKIEGSLNELMEKNIKLCQELQNKITISSFMNETETKTKKYFTQFVLSSRKRVKDIKTGLELENVIKKGSKNLKNICNSIDNDVYIKNGEFLLNEKNKINQKIPKEKHMKIHELINNINHVIKPTKIKSKSNSHRIVKSVPESQMQKVKTIINNEIAKDEKLFKKKLNFYKKNLLTFAETQPKKFYSMASHLYLKSNLKMINYSKPSRDSLHEQKVLNILKIRGHLKKSREGKDKNETDIMNIYYPNKDKNFLNTNKNDTIMVIKDLAKKRLNLEAKTKKNMRRINSMIDIKLPYFSNYYKTIKFCRNMGLTTGVEKNYEKQDYQFKFKKNAKSKIDLIKNEIKLLTRERIRKDCEDIEQKKQSFIFN